MSRPPTASGALRGRIEDLVFVALAIAVAALVLWLAERHALRWDWTENARNTLSEPSRRLLSRLDAPIRLTAYARDAEVVRKAVRQLVARYRREHRAITLEFVDPAREPARTRAAGVSVDGEIVVEYRGREARARRLTEADLSSALGRAARGPDRRIVAFLAGHGERDLLGRANHDLGEFGDRLRQRGYRLQPLELAAIGAVPDNAALLVVSDPAVDLLAGERDALLAFLRAGGNLLWLADPGAGEHLGWLAEALGVRFVPGTVLDPRAAAAGIDNPALVPVTDYSGHPALGGFSLTTLFARAAGIETEAREGWSASVLAASGAASWAEGAGEPRRRAGPLALAVALSRAPPAERDREQRVVVLGDGDLLANAFLGNGGNLELGLRLVEWLAGGDTLIDVPPLRAADLDLEFSRRGALALAFAALLGVPALLLGAGLWRWRARRRR